jgi:hypothetical protein
MPGTQVDAYERQSAELDPGTGNLNLSASFTPAAGETLVVWFTSGTEKCKPTGPPPSSGGVTWTERGAIALTNTCTIYCWTGVVPSSPAAVNPSVPYNYTGTATTAAHLIVQRFAGVTLPASPNVAESSSGVTTSGTGGATLPITQQSPDSLLAWVAADWNGVISGSPTPANDDTLSESFLFSPAGILSSWGYYRASTGTGAKTVGFSSFSSSATRKFTFVAIELPATTRQLTRTDPATSGTTGTLRNATKQLTGIDVASSSENAVLSRLQPGQLSSTDVSASGTTGALRKVAKFGGTVTDLSSSSTAANNGRVIDARRLARTDAATSTSAGTHRAARRLAPTIDPGHSATVNVTPISDARPLLGNDFADSTTLFVGEYSRAVNLEGIDRATSRTFAFRFDIDISEREVFGPAYHERYRTAGRGVSGPEITGVDPNTLSRYVTAQRDRFGRV